MILYLVPLLQHSSRPSSYWLGENWKRNLFNSISSPNWNPNCKSFKWRTEINFDLYRRFVALRCVGQGFPGTQNISPPVCSMFMESYNIKWLSIYNFLHLRVIGNQLQAIQSIDFLANCLLPLAAKIGYAKLYLFIYYGQLCNKNLSTL